MKSEQIQDSQHNFNLDCESESCSVLSDSLWPHGLQSPWNSPDQNTGVGSLSLLQGIFPTPGSNPSLLCLLYWQADSLPLVPAGKPWWLKASHIYYLPFLEKFKLCFMALKSRCLVELGPSWCLWGENLFLVPSHPLVATCVPRLVAPYIYFQPLVSHLLFLLSISCLPFLRILMITLGPCG